MASLPPGGARGGRSPSLISATNLHLFSLIPIVVRLKTKRKIAKAKKNINKGSLLAKSRAFFDCTEPWVQRLHWTLSSTKVNHSLDCTEPLVRRKSTTHLIALNLLLGESLSLIWLYWTFPVDELKCRALNKITASLRYRNDERSLSKRRAFGN